MRRREFILLIGGAAATWPLAARAQEPSGVRRIGVLMNISDDPEGKARLAAFRQSLEQLGWIDGRNVRIDTKWADGDVERIRRLATEMSPNHRIVILATGSAAAAPLLQATRTVPIVFVNTPDPVGAAKPFAKLNATFRPRSRSRHRPKEQQPPHHKALAGPDHSQNGGRFVLSWKPPRPKRASPIGHNPFRGSLFPARNVTFGLGRMTANVGQWPAAKLPRRIQNGCASCRARS